jgi:hypothetical protein
MRPTSIYDGQAHSVTLLRSPVEKSRPGVRPPGRGAALSPQRCIGVKLPMCVPDAKIWEALV